MGRKTDLDALLVKLLNSRRVAALGTQGLDGSPFVSMVPFTKLIGESTVVIHVSSLAPHTANMEKNSTVSLMIMAKEPLKKMVHALPRVTFKGEAKSLSTDTPEWNTARTAYLRRFPEAMPMTLLDDFKFIEIQLNFAHQVAGFGAARSLDKVLLKTIFT